MRIDVLLAYLGGDILDIEVTSRFLRNGLEPILKKLQCAAIVNSHTPKTTYRDTSNWKANDWLYAGAGNADIANWARAALVIDPTRVRGIYNFIAAKRGTRIGWCDEQAQTTLIARLFCWDKGAIFWREATDEDAQRVEATKPKVGKRA
jgi:hypothetical protein